MQRQNIGVLMVLASAGGFATLGVLIKVAYAAQAEMITVLAYRFLFAAIIFWSIVKIRALPIKLTCRELLKLIIIGSIGYGLMSVLFAGTLMYLPASLAGVLLYTYPALVSLLTYLLGDEDLSTKNIAALIICLTGLVLVLGVSLVGLNTIGVILGLGSAVTYSGYIVISNRMLKYIHPLLVTTVVCSAAAVVFIIFGLATGKLIVALPLKAWLAIIGITVFATCIGILGFFVGMNLIGASNAAILSTFEPVVTVVLSVAFLGEKLTLLQIFGGLLICAGVVLLQYKDSNPEPPVKITENNV